MRERERVNHHREPRAEAPALRRRIGDQERELGAPIRDLAKVAIAGEHAVAQQDERPRAIREQALVVLEHVALGERLRVPEQRRVLGSAVRDGERCGMRAHLVEPRLERDQISPPGDPVLHHARA